MRSMMKILLVGTLLLGACAGPQLSPERPPEPSASQQLDLLTRSLGELRQNPYAAKAEVELAKAERWLRQVEAIRANEDADKSRIPLLLEAVETQLVSVHARFARLQAEEQLADAQERYKTEQQRIEQFQQQNDAIRKETMQP